MKKKMVFGCLLAAALVLVTGCSITKNTLDEKAYKPGLPITKEKKQITYLASANAEIMALCDGDMNKLPFYQELEDRTNVHINWVTSMKELNTAYQLGETRDQTPDIIEQYALQDNYSVFLDEYVKNGTIMDLTDLVREYAPNYYKIIQEPEIKKFAYTNTGRIAAIYSIRQEEQGAFGGLMIRKDWLDELGLEIPVTYDDWEKVLTAFKEKKGAVAPIYLPDIGYYYDNSLSVGFGTVYGMYHVKDKVYYGPSENEWKDYLALLHDWYEKGLIDPAFRSCHSFCMQEDMMVTGAIGAGCTWYTIPSKLSFDDKNKDADYIAVSPPKKKAKDELHFQRELSYYDNFLTISADCPNPELALRWIDYLFSEEGAMFANYGIEGETYVLDKDQKPVYTDLILNNPDGLTFIEALKTYTFPQGIASAYIDWRREWQSVPEKDIKMCEVWDASYVDGSYTFPSDVTYTAEEAARLSELTPLLKSIVDENAPRFIMGSRSLDEYDDYVDELKANGLDEMIAIHQNAYDRYCKDHAND